MGEAVSAEGEMHETLRQKDHIWTNSGEHSTEEATSQGR